jgi:hypothetical protein
MKPIRYILGVIGFIAVWFVVAAVVGLCLSFLFPPAGPDAFGFINCHLTLLRFPLPIQCRVQVACSPALAVPAQLLGLSSMRQVMVQPYAPATLTVG